MKKVMCVCVCIYVFVCLCVHLSVCLREQPSTESFQSSHSFKNLFYHQETCFALNQKALGREAQLPLLLQSLPCSSLNLVTFDLKQHSITYNLSGFGNPKYPTVISRINTDQHANKYKNEHLHILTLTFVTLTFNCTETNRIQLILGVLCPSHRQNSG